MLYRAAQGHRRVSGGERVVFREEEKAKSILRVVRKGNPVWILCEHSVDRSKYVPAISEGLLLLSLLFQLAGRATRSDGETKKEAHTEPATPTQHIIDLAFRNHKYRPYTCTQCDSYSLRSVLSPPFSQKRHPGSCTCVCTVRVTRNTGVELTDP